MRALIVEDELLAQKNLKNIIANNVLDIEIVDCLSSVKAAVEWFSNSENSIDIVFMDVELSDGTCFDVFELVDVDAKIIMTTAFDSYAIKAFKVNSVDYILKPIDPEELVRAIEKCRKALAMDRDRVGDCKADAGLSVGVDLDADTGLSAEVGWGSVKRDNDVVKRSEVGYKKRFTVKFGSRIIIIMVEDIAYFYSMTKTTNVMLKSGRNYIIDESLDAIEAKLNPEEFFRASRSLITSISAIDRIYKQSANRIKLMLKPDPEFDVFISRFRISSFLQWTNQ